ncbi:aconitase family protein, partial [Brevibacterium paucivorans]
LEVGDKSYEIYRLSAVDDSDKLPFSLKVLLENLLRTEDGANITEDHIKALASWDPKAEPSVEIQFTPARVVMQDFTGVPCIVTDSHTTMVNGLGVLGWGVGGIEAEAAMLGQPVSMLIPRVVGFKLKGEIPSGVTATDV